MTGELYGDGGLDCLAEVPLWQRHLECFVSVPVYALLAYKGHRMIKASVDEGTSETSQFKHRQSDAWLAVLLAFVLGWEFVLVAPPQQQQRIFPHPLHSSRALAATSSKSAPSSTSSTPATSSPPYKYTSSAPLSLAAA